MLRKVIKAIIPAGLFKALAPYGHAIEAAVYNVANGLPARRMKVIGVTGTNGKTTTCYMIHRMLHEAGYKVGMMTTVSYGAGLELKPQMTHMTTVSAPVLFRRIRQMREAGVEWLVLEMTSHSLAQNRAWGVPFSIAVMTNITHEHISYHGTFEKYVQAKMRLFELATAHRSGLRAGVINADDPSSHRFETLVQGPVTYGVISESADLQPANVVSTPEGSSYDLEAEGRKMHIDVNLPGSFNVSNSLAAVGVGLLVGLSAKQIERGIAAVKTVEGRMVRVDEGQDFAAIVDYAHTPDSFEKLFGDLKPMVKGKLIVVFGSQGRTGDVSKRPLQGKLAGQYADEVVLTEEDDRGENGTVILEAIATAAEEAGKVRNQNLFLVHDRREAIRFAVGRAQAGDAVMFLGKGHEKTIQRGEHEEPWDEVGEVRAALKARSK